MRPGITGLGQCHGQNRPLLCTRRGIAVVAPVNTPLCHQLHYWGRCKGPHLRTIHRQQSWQPGRVRGIYALRSGGFRDRTSNFLLLGHDWVRISRIVWNCSVKIFEHSVCHLLIQELIHVCHVSRNPVVMVSPAVSVVGNGVLSPRVASFSSRGPSLLFPGILKVYIITNLLTWDK